MPINVNVPVGFEHSRSNVLELVGHLKVTVLELKVDSPIHFHKPTLTFPTYDLRKSCLVNVDAKWKLAHLKAT
jgi:hypothetical protein